MLGNRETWQRVEPKCLHPRKVLVLFGPTGCGKTEGVRSLARAMGLRLVEFDGSDLIPERIGAMARDTVFRGMRGRALLLDDFSFTARRREVAQLLLGQERDTNVNVESAFCPIVITCTQVRHPDMRDLCLFSERLRSCASNQRMVRTHVRGGGVPRRTTQHVLPQVDQSQIDLCATGSCVVSQRDPMGTGADFKRTESEIEATRRRRASRQYF